MHSTTIFVPQYFETKQVFILCVAVELAGYCTFCMLATIKRYLVFCPIKIIISIYLLLSLLFMSSNFKLILSRISQGFFKRH